MTGRPLFAEHAEEVVAGCALASRHGAGLAASRLDRRHFNDPKCRALFEAAVVCELVDQDDRIHDCALDADVDPRFAARVVADRPVQWDTAGGYAAEIVAKAAARRRAEALLVELDDLGVHVYADELVR